MSADLVRILSRADLSESTVMALSVSEARKAQAAFRAGFGFVAKPVALLTQPDGNVKLDKSSSSGVLAYGLSLAPAGLSGFQVCRYRTAGCEAVCLNTSGKGAFPVQQRARVWKTRWLAAAPALFVRLLVHEIDRIPVAEKSAAGWTISLRLNVLSDLPWEQIAPWVVARAVARGIRVYDYTKWPTRRRAGAIGLGYDLSESVTEKTCRAGLLRMRRPVVVFAVGRGGALPATYMGRPVVDGDKSDARFLDPAGVVVGLRFKRVTTGSLASGVESGFVRVAQ